MSFCYLLSSIVFVDKSVILLTVISLEPLFLSGSDFAFFTSFSRKHLVMSEHVLVVLV